MKIKKRDGREVAFDENKITEAIFKAAKAVGGADKQLAIELTLDVLRLLKQEYNAGMFGVEEVQDVGRASTPRKRGSPEGRHAEAGRPPLQQGEERRGGQQLAVAEAGGGGAEV